MGNEFVLFPIMPAAHATCPGDTTGMTLINGTYYKASNGFSHTRLSLRKCNLSFFL